MISRRALLSLPLLGPLAKRLGWGAESKPTLSMHPAQRAMMMTGEHEVLYGGGRFPTATYQQIWLKDTANPGEIVRIGKVNGKIVAIERRDQLPFVLLDPFDKPWEVLRWP